MKNMIWALLLIGFNVAIAEVKVSGKVTVIYDRTPKLYIAGSGFDADAHDIILELSATDELPLTKKDFALEKNEKGLILKLFGSRRWASLTDKVPPVFLTLSKVMFASDPNTNLLSDPVNVAQVLASPTVASSDTILYTSASQVLRINGTGFTGVKDVKLYFSPPLYVEIDYEVFIRGKQLSLRLRDQAQWRDGEGPLLLLGIDTGGGVVKLGADGVVVANVVPNKDSHDVSVTATADTQLIYNDAHNLLIEGSGFNPLGTKLGFSNYIKEGTNFNYSVSSITDTTISLKLVSGSLWRPNVESLPGVLNLRVIDTGDGFLSVGPINSKKGVNIATVFERPEVHSGSDKLFRTQSHELHIFGKGFPKVMTKTQLKFSPPLVVDKDYTIETISRTELEVTLLDKKAWRPDVGDLIVTHINTRGDEDGWIAVGGTIGVHVAAIVDNIDADATGGIEVHPMGIKVYQSALQEKISINGNGFKEGMTFNFEPDLKENVDYRMSIVSKNEIVLKLVPGKKWHTTAGFITAKSVNVAGVNVAGKTYPLAGTEGIRIATVFKDPLITPGKDNFHETQSKVISVFGTGFTNAADTKIVLTPTIPQAYKVLNVFQDTIRLQLKPENDWLPSYTSLKDNAAAKSVPLSVVSIDTGAGSVTLKEPVTIGFVVADREGVVCDDSCRLAFDGFCDDGSEGDYEEYYESYGYYQDDNGGFYEGSESAAGEKAGGGAYGDSYSQKYDDYYTEDAKHVAPCTQGTDCTDCGGVDVAIDLTKAPDPSSGIETCVNTCIYARDGICDDPRGKVGSKGNCKVGTDCQDCGPVGAQNFTSSDDDGKWEDDDDYWTFDDGSFLDQVKGLNENRDKVKVFKKPDSQGPGWMFLVVLEGMVYTVGAIFAAAALYLGMRWYKGQSVPFMNVFNPDSQMSQQELSLLPSRRMPITPDVIRT